MKKQIPFFPNTKNDARCMQAVMRMVLAAEGIRSSFSTLDRKTGRSGNQWTWNAPTMLAMQRLGFGGILYENISYAMLASRYWRE